MKRKRGASRGSSVMEHLHENMSEPMAEWCNRTSWHGVHDLKEAGSCCARCGWLVVLVVTSFMWSTQCYNHIDTWIKEDPWVSQTYFKRFSASFQDVDSFFPNITVCSLNRVSKKRLTLLNMSLEVASYIVDGMMRRGFEANEPQKEMDYRNAFLEYCDDYGMNSSMSIDHWIDLIAPTCDDLFNFCHMGPNSYSKLGQFKCCENVREIYATEYGRCYSVRPPPRIFEKFPQEYVDAENGLHLYLNTDLEDYADYESYNRPSEGFLVFIGYSPAYSFYTRPIALNAGSHAWIGMTVNEEVMRLRTSSFLTFNHFNPPLPCQYNGSLDLIEGEFAFETCRKDCVIKEYYKLCDCVLLNPVKPGVRICDPIRSHLCRISVGEHATALNASLGFGNLVQGLPPLRQLARPCVEKQCQQPCDKRKIVVRSSFNRYPSKNNYRSWVKYLRNVENISTSLKEVRERSVASVFFESTKARVVEQRIRTTMEDLISQIGGTLGVWAGMSIVTLYQMFAYTVYYLVTPAGIAKRQQSVRRIRRQRQKLATEPASTNRPPSIRSAPDDQQYIYYTRW